MRRLADWLLDGRFACQGHCVDIGRTTYTAVRCFIDTGQSQCPKNDPNFAGNGSLVRLASVVLRHLHDAAEVERISRLQSRCTHPASSAADACAVLALLLRETILGIPNALAPRTWCEPTHPDIAAVAGGSFLSLHRPRPTGYVADTLEVALWAVHHTEDFEQALIAATSLGGDADSIGAVTGMLAGALYGLHTIPQRWLRRLAWRGKILAVAVKLLAVSPTSAASRQS